jgi:site-specific recombinase XerD
MTTRQLSRLFHETADAAGIKKNVTLHALRHNAESRIMPSNLIVALVQRTFVEGHSA